MGTLFEPASLGTLKLRNRFVRSATQDWLAEKDGQISDAQISLYTALAAGGAGLIITAHSAVSLPLGRAGNPQNAISHDKYIAGYSRLTDAVHKHGARIILQLSHAGCQTDRELTEGEMPVGPSDVFNAQGLRIARAMTHGELEKLIDDFGVAAMRAKRAGVDGVQVHIAHGYALAQFLSPWSNQRTDDYGGSRENRLRLLAEVIWRIREAVGGDFPVLVKLNTTDGVDAPETLTLDDVVCAAQTIADHGATAIEASGGTGRVSRLVMANTGIVKPEQESYFAPAAAAIKAKVSLPVLLVGGNRSRAVMEANLAQGKADFISLSRPFVREPDLVNRLAAGQEKAACISCNACFNPKGLRCCFTDKK
ncbi:NADH:flavin oxidoreductase [Acetonema longum]|uniref:NADH:flavin oxidoreductase n=1 Tax=Acetonema longum DSM 6540 TaxID=1009370 RepID=F7NG70_9FIRM|nr:NADH:flavin oxidoreductase [Acetonema longum]EGO64988.1 NADH:flavin oxidoreductase [Acetonema longum DSM 6540]